MKNLLLLLLISKISFAQTIGLMECNLSNKNGYVLFSPISNTFTFLIDKCGKKIHEWTSTYRPGQSVYFLENGKLLRTASVNNATFGMAGGKGGKIELMDWNSNVTWSFQISDTMQLQHHDIKPLPNGNILAIVWERRMVAEAIAQGRNPANLGTELWSEKILELQPTGTNTANIVWEWKAWEHLVQDFDSTKPNYDTVSKHPELINLNYFSGSATQSDWLHINSIDYNSATDQILLSIHNFDEIIVIDHSTTTAEASSHSGGNSGKGGDLLYRWGNPQTYNRGTSTDQKFFGQHNAQWIPAGFPNAGKIIVFNNGNGRPAGAFSSIDIIETPIDGSNNYPVGATNSFLPNNLFWTYTATVPTDFYSSNISGVQVLENGSMQICSGSSGIFFEIDSNKNTLWKYINPVNNSGAMTQGTTPTNNPVFRSTFIEPNFAGLTGQTLTAGTEIEFNPNSPSICDTISNGFENISAEKVFSVFPNPSGDYLKISVSPFQNNLTLSLFNSLGEQLVNTKINSSDFLLDISDYGNGLYFLKINNGREIYSEKFVKEK